VERVPKLLLGMLGSPRGTHISLLQSRLLDQTYYLQTFTPKLAERLTHVIYHEPTLRNSILRGLKALVEGNAAALNTSTEGKDDTDNDSGDGDESYSQVGSDFAGDRIDPNTSRKDEDVPLISKEEARKNIEYLNKQAKSWLAVLFNVFTGMDKDSRGMAGEVISAWAGIANDPVNSWIVLPLI
jgi:ribosomal RNA-processing protein 12